MSAERPGPDEYATPREVAAWLGKSLASLQRYRREEEHCPRPDAYKGRQPRWLRTRKPDWLKWYVTYGPGRPAPMRVVSASDQVELEEELRRKYEAGATLRELAEDKGLSYGTVHRLVHRAGGEIRCGGELSETAKSLRNMSPAARLELAKDLRRQYEADADTQALSDTSGLSVATIWNLLHEVHTPMRDPGRKKGVPGTRKPRKPGPQSSSPCSS